MKKTEKKNKTLPVDQVGLIQLWKTLQNLVTLSYSEEIPEERKIFLYIPYR